MSWLDAPAVFRVKGQPIIGKTMTFEHEGFIRDYEVVKHEKPEMAGPGWVERHKYVEDSDRQQLKIN